MTTINFIQHDGREYVVDAQDGDTVMRTANNNGVPGIIADCGGSMTCATCHVYLPEEWFDRLEPPCEDEVAMLEVAIDPRPNSRLSCQIIVNDALEGLTVNVPKNQF